jgi:ubiquinol-cytochrome c reductase cytochrome b subunit
MVKKCDSILFISILDECTLLEKTISISNSISISCYNKVPIFNNMLTQSAGLSTLVVNSQRLNAEDLMWLVGFVEVYGSFSVNKNGNYFKCEFSIELSIKDIQLLYKIKEILGGYGSITCRKRENVELCRLKISSKHVLIQVICPIFDKYPMLTSKHFDYIHFRNSLFINNSLYNNLPSYVRPSSLPILDVNSILALPYFDSWLVGFIEAEGYFSSYLPETFYTANYHLQLPQPVRLGMSSSFGVVQKNGQQIITAIKQRLRLRSNPYFNSKTQCYSINTTSTRGIQNVIVFLSNTSSKLKGHKRALYLKWLHEIRVNPKYSNVKVPFKY